MKYRNCLRLMSSFGAFIMLQLPTSEILAHEVLQGSFSQKVFGDHQSCLEVENAAIASNRERFGLESKITVSNRSFCYQNLNLANKVNFDLALGLAIDSILNDDTDIESPLALMVQVVGETGNAPFPYSADVYAAARQELSKMVRLGSTSITLVNMSQLAEHGESPRNNWIFRIKIPTLSDHIFWAIVDRSGVVEAYNYGFN